MARRGLRVWGLTCFVAASVAFVGGRSHAANLDENGEITLGLRSYVNARVGTQSTDNEFNIGDRGDGQPDILQKSKTFPYSPAGHLRQNRFFLELEWKHDLRRLQEEGFGPLGVLNQLPFRVRNLRYGVTFRAEGDGLYDWGPSEYRTAEQWRECGDNDVRGCLSANPATGFGFETDPTLVNPQIAEANKRHLLKLRRNLRKDGGVHRERLFQAYVEGDLGSNLWFRFGRQILSWGESDAFRLIDNINPIDSSFGGFLVPLDERRVPLDMLRMTYRIGEIGPMYDTFVEMYGAVDNRVAIDPGTPAGGPWSLPNTGVPGSNTKSIISNPARNFSDMRGGGRFVFNIGDGTFSLAHYYTYMDIPALETSVKPYFFNKKAGDPLNPAQADLFAFPTSEGDYRYSVQADQRIPLTQITGATMTFALPDLYSILRGELAYFHDEARFSQEQLDPFLYHYYGRYKQLDAPNEQGYRFVQDDSAAYGQLPASVLTRACDALALGVNNGVDPKLCRTQGGRRLGDSIKMVLGWDTNQFIRALNPHQSFFISTQFFYQRLLGYDEPSDYAPNERRVRGGEVLPVTEYDTWIPQTQLNTLGAVEPNFIRQPRDTFLHTLLITTSYRSGTIVPSLVFFYDWGGATVFVPAIQVIQDPFRFGVEYSILNAGRLKGGSGVSLVRDRDTVQFRIEYVI